MPRSRAVLAAALLAVTVVVPSAAGAETRDDADHFEVFFPAGDGSTTLRAEVLRPKGLPGHVRTPVVMTVGPYFNQNDFVSPQETGAHRFYDFLDLTRILDKGYTYVMVDLPGFGGSSGCNDWGGFREQRAVEAAVEWAATQRWSTGKVGLIGKSYDGWTGLMGIARQPKGLAAVVAMEPVYSGYRYLYTNGVRFANSLSTGLIFQLLDAQPGSPSSSVSYQTNGLPQAWCYGVNVALQQQDESNVPFWMERDLLAPSIGKKTPLFLTQGFLERNTLPDAAFDFFNRLAGPKRAWFGQFDHVRGWQKDGKRFLTGREGFIQESMRFLDRHLKGVRAADDPPVVVQDNRGRYRAERRWPPGDAVMWRNSLNPGSYADDGRNSGSGPRADGGVWTFSQRLPHDVWMAGEPVIQASVETTVPRANLVANIYDVDSRGEAVLISRGAHLLRETGSQKVTFELYGQDWFLRKGHRIGVLVSGSNTEWWVHVPTGSDITVQSARAVIPFLEHRRTVFLDGRASPRLKEHTDSAYPIPAESIEKGARSFRLPPPLD